MALIIKYGLVFYDIEYENEHLVELEWFGLKREDNEVREKYKNWLNDPLITSSLASPDLDNAKKD